MKEHKEEKKEEKDEEPKAEEELSLVKTSIEQEYIVSNETFIGGSVATAILLGDRKSVV